MDRPKRNWKHYKWRLFYYNPEDPSIFVDKQFGIGWDLNFGHRKSWKLVLFLILIPVLVVLIPVLLLE